MSKQINKPPALVLMTRWPGPNRCKTRLASKIGFYKAALIQEKLIEHTIKVSKGLEEKNLIEIFFATSGIAENLARRWSKAQGLKNVSNQGSGNLGLRLRRQLLRVQKQQIKRTTLFIGTDLPSLSKRDLVEAIEMLKYNQLVLGPSKDGGYWLIGFSGSLLKPVTSWPFIDIPWGTSKVLERTIKLALSKDIKHYLLHEQNDIDVLEDLYPWQG